jgi:DNA-binding NarL/FixJ family response regulator
MPTTVIKRKAQSLEGVTVEWRGGEYDARYRVRNSTLIKLLAITPAEQQHLSCMISTGEKQRRNTQYQSTKRRSRGVVERSEYEHKAQERRQQALDLKGTGMTQAAIAEALRVSQKTVSGYLSK